MQIAFVAESRIAEIDMYANPRASSTDVLPLGQAAIALADGLLDLLSELSTAVANWLGLGLGRGSCRGQLPKRSVRGIKVPTSHSPIEKRPASGFGGVIRGRDESQQPGIFGSSSDYEYGRGTD